MIALSVVLARGEVREVQIRERLSFRVLESGRGRIHCWRVSLPALGLLTAVLCLGSAGDSLCARAQCLAY